MMTLPKPNKKYYNATEAARLLNITVEALYQIVDQHVFTPEHPRPDALEFTHSELLLMTVWAKPEPGGNLLHMPHRR